MKNFILLLAFILIHVTLRAQKVPDGPGTRADSLLNMIAGDNGKEQAAIFESSRLILSQSNETVKKKNLNFLVLHRFGNLAGSQGGGKTFFGLDNIADAYIGFEYGLTNNLTAGIGRSAIPSTGGLATMELKYAALHQTNDNSTPVAITLIGQTGIRLYNTFPGFSDRLSYFGQVIIARKFSPVFSLQIAPSVVQNNLPVPDVAGSEKLFLSASATAALKISKLMSVVVDYAHPFSSYRSANAYSDPLGFGIQVVTGGHVFTINITNSRGISELNYLSRTTADYFRGEYRLGFTLSRTFDFNHKEKYNPKR